MASQDYDEWNQYLIKKFFIESNPGSCIRLNVYPEWFNRVPVLDGMGGLLDFLSAMSTICEGTDLYDLLEKCLYRQQHYPHLMPLHVGLMAYLCLPWTINKTNYWIQSSEWMRGRSKYNYWDALNQLCTENKVSAQRLLSTNNRFRYLLDDANPRNNLLYWLYQWSKINEEIPGIFCYCHVYEDKDDKVSMLRSQVVPTEIDLEWMPERLFRFTDQSKELTSEEMSSFCSQAGNMRYTLSSYKKLFFTSDSLGKLLKNDVCDQLYEGYLDWVSEGRVLESNITDSELSSDGLSRMHSHSPRLLLRLKKVDEIWEKSLFVENFPLSEGAIDRNWKIHVDEISWNGQLKRLKSGDFLLKCEDDIWDAIASSGYNTSDVLSSSFKVGDFTFCQSLCYVLIERKNSVLVQVKDIPENSLFWILYSTEYANRVKRWIDDANIDCDPAIAVDEKWLLQYIKIDNPEQVSFMPNGFDNNVARSVLCRLTGGIKERCATSFRRRYIRDFLPNIEAYLPSSYSFRCVQDNGDEFDNSLDIIRELDEDDQDDVQLHSVWINDLSGIDLQAANNNFIVRSFSVHIPDGYEGSTIKVQFYVKNRCYGRELKIAFSPKNTNDSSLSNDNHIMDKFGEIRKSDSLVSYWPDSIEEIDFSQFQPTTFSSREIEDDVCEKYWSFIRHLSAVQGENGIPGKEFWELVCYHFESTPMWKRRILLLSYLGVIDIVSNEIGLWTRFFLNKPALCLLPVSDSSGKVQAVLTGAFLPETISQLKALSEEDDGIQVSVLSQENENQEHMEMLPPRVLIRANTIRQLRGIANQLDLQWAGIASKGFAELSGSVEEWYDTAQQFKRDGLPKNSNVEGWYVFLSYRTETRNSTRVLTNPMDQCPALFTKCMCKYPANFISNFSVFDLVDKQDNSSIYVKDRSWGRWVSYILPEGYPKFKIAYIESTGSIILPKELTLPKILARSLTLCSGKIPVSSSRPFPYDLMQGNMSQYGLSISPYAGGCTVFNEIPKDIADLVAYKLHAEIKKVLNVRGGIR